MKKMTSLMLAFVLIFSLSVSAYAVESSNSAPVADEYGRVFLSEEETLAFFEAQDSEDIQPDENELSRAVGSLGPGYVSVGIAETIARPLIWEQETKRLFYLEEVGVKTTYSPLYSNALFKLTTSEADNMYNRALAFMANHNENGYSYFIVGWYVETLVELRTISPSTPLYIEYRAAEPNFGQGSDYEKTNISQSIVSFRIGAACQFPSDANDTEYYQIGGVEGLFWYRAENGRVLGIPFGARLGMNSQTLED